LALMALYCFIKGVTFFDLVVANKSKFMNYEEPLSIGLQGTKTKIGFST
jgi:hypothetical protein